MRAHSQHLQDRIREAIVARGGSIGFDQFMQMALYEPGLGYYTSAWRKFGEQGDFITAPEVSPLFGRCLGNYCQHVLSSIDDGNILEFGAGSGRMAADILTELDARNALPSAYLIMEVSAELQHRQRQTIQATVPHLLERVQWLQTLPEPGFCGIILGNELLDAMPVQRFRLEANAVRALGVTWSEIEARFVLQSMDAGQALKQAVEHIQQTTGNEFSDGYESELSLAQGAWLQSVGDSMERGVVLLIDYGYGRPEYYHPQRHMGTLMCHFRHRAHDDPFRYIGLQDITAYVDFTAVAEAAVNNGMQLLGYTTQCGFLLENGLEVMMPDPESVSQQALMAFAQQVKTLTLPSEMGERFKVMALGKDFDHPLPGFTLQDQRGRL
jgi:SAM-dependent MidA family methyltransferase